MVKALKYGSGHTFWKSLFMFVFTDSGMTDIEMMYTILMVVSLMYLSGILVVTSAFTSVM